MKKYTAEGITVLSLFDGMSCGQLALQRAGIKVNQYYASEIDKYAIKVTQKNFPNTIQLGDVTKIKGSDLPKIDLIIGGSPCQGFSFAGKKLNFKDERSKLFFEFVRLINECNPKWFFLENVKMKKEHELVISKYMKVAPIEINSALVSAQNRVRLYWTNINEKPYGLFGDMMPDIPQPKDKGILLKDILESDVPEKYYLSEKMIKWLTKHSGKRGCEFKKLDGNQKASCLTTTEAKQNLGNDYICVASRGRNPENPKSREAGLNTQQMLEPRCDGKTNCLTSVQKDNLVMLNERQKANHKREDEKANTLLSTSWKGSQANGMTLVGKTKIRRLTPTECERLQTVPDGYTDCVSDTQRYKMLGNGWTVDVIAHFFLFLKSDEKSIFEPKSKC